MTENVSEYWNETFRVGVVGAGEQSDESIIPALRAIPADVEVVALADTDTARAAQVAANHAIHRVFA